MALDNSKNSPIVIIGGGVSGLMAAEVLVEAGLNVAVYDAMPSVGRKFLLAGKGGLNLTHSEPFTDFVSRYGQRQAQITPFLKAFNPDNLRTWAAELGVETFIGSSGRVFPVEMKAAPLLRAWLRRLRRQGVTFHPRHRWNGWNNATQLRFITDNGEKSVQAQAVILALGGGSWKKLGSDGAWLPFLKNKGVKVVPLQPSNCGFEVAWSEYFRNRFAATPLKSITLSFTAFDGQHYQQRGELMLTETGIEGSLVYALSAPLRETIHANGKVDIYLDLSPDRNILRLSKELTETSNTLSLANRLRRCANIQGVKAGLLREVLSHIDMSDSEKLAKTIKVLPLRLTAPRPIDEAISSAGGVSFDALDPNLMLKNLPGIFCAGEMLDWEAPTGGYLLTACFASGRAAGFGVLNWLHNKKP